MSLGLNKTKRRILSVKATKKITKAMEMVATVKLKRFRTLFENGNLYQESMTNFMSNLFSHDEPNGSHYGKENEQAKGILYIVITSDLGLCAGYNNEVYKYVDSIMTPNDTLAPIGAKGVSHFCRDDGRYPYSDRFSQFSLAVDMGKIHQASSIIKDQFNQGQYRKIVIVYTKYINSLKCEPSTLQLLPVPFTGQQEGSIEANPPLFEPDARKMIHELMPQYLASLFYWALIESQVSEQASRRNAMDSANDNADEIINKLTIEYNKARQGAITQEITEVISGSNS